MRNLILATAALGCLPGALHAQPKPADLSGAWAVEGEIEAPQGVALAQPVCTFQQTGAQLAGACEGPGSTGPATGSVAGQHVTWRWAAKARNEFGGTGEGAFDGELGADGTIRGSMTLDILPGAKGTFTAKRR
ncbi:MAG: hypothetical protein ACJ798_01030 [Phenylobacterium sp.]